MDSTPAEFMLNHKNFSEEIGVSFESLRSITQFSRDYILLLDLKGNVLFVNRVVCAPFSAMLGKSIFSILKGAERKVFRAAYDKSIDSRTKVDCNIKYANSFGNTKVFKISIAPLIKLNNVVASVLNVYDTKLQADPGFSDEDIEQQKIDYASNQRNVLVREVHHRIKNNLQGIIGLLTESLQDQPQLQKKMDTVLNQIRSIALIHGLQGQSSASELVLCELVPAIVNSVRNASDVPIEVDLNIDVMRTIQIANEDAVPIALVLNELLFNAVKHRSVTNSSFAVRVQLKGDFQQGEIRIFTPGARLPEDFDFSNRKYIGTGLELVKALLPHAGANLRIYNSNFGVESELLLSFPVIFMRQE